MSLETKRIIIGALGFLFLLSLVFVQYMEVARRHEEAGLVPAHIVVPSDSKACVDCHAQSSPGVVDHWKGSTHARSGVGCLSCHQAQRTEPDGFEHYGVVVATIVTPRDCARCHTKEGAEFQKSHHSKAGDILASLDNFLAETVEGSRVPFNPHGPTPGKPGVVPNGMASAASGCQQCHGSKVALMGTDGKKITVNELAPGPDGLPTNKDAVGRIVKDANGKPVFDHGTWPNTGIGRLNLDGSRGSCSACHSRHDFSPRRARQPENCGKCHLGPDHPQKEIYEESKHGVAYRDLKDKMGLEKKDWVLGQDYSQAPTCATCHMSGHSRNEGRITHDPGERISWTNRPPVSLVMDTDATGKIVTEADETKRAALVAEPAEVKRDRMKAVCSHCHSKDYVTAFYKQYDDLVVLYNEKFAKPGQKLIAALRAAGLITKTEFDEPVEWQWYYLWHHEGRRARHGASMMAPDYTHWHGMFEVAERFYEELIPEVEKVLAEAEAHGKGEAAAPVRQLLKDLMDRPEHQWKSRGAEEATAAIQKAMQERYGQGGGAAPGGTTPPGSTPTPAPAPGGGGS